MTSGSFWNHYRDETNHSANDANNYRINNSKTTTNKSFEYKTKIIGRTASDNDIWDTEVVVPLKYLSNFWRSVVLALTIIWVGFLGVRFDVGGGITLLTPLSKNC